MYYYLQVGRFEGDFLTLSCLKCETLNRLCCPKDCRRLCAVVHDELLVPPCAIKG